MVRIIPINELSPPTFKAWTDRLVGYLKSLPGTTLHLVFDDYHSDERQIYLSKGRPDKGRERRISDLSQKLPNLSDWNDFLTNDVNKLQVTQLLADYLLSGDSHINKDVYVTKGSKCMFLLANESGPGTEISDLHSFHREADPRLALDAVYASSKHAGTCVVADDTDVYILLLFVARQCGGLLYFRQGTSTSKVGITYHNIKELAEHLGPELCECLPAFHVVTGSDYTQPFFGRSKFQIFRKVQKNLHMLTLLSTLGSSEPNLDEVVDFVLHVVYNRPKKEKTPGESRYAMLFHHKAKKRVLTPLQRLVPDKSSLKCAILRMNHVTHGMVNCLNPTYSQLDPLLHGWRVEMAHLCLFGMSVQLFQKKLNSIEWRKTVQLSHQNHPM